MSESVFTLLESVQPEWNPRARCERCQKQYGKDRPELLACLRCPHCDFPFGETIEGIRALTFALQDPKKQDYVSVYSQAVCYVWLCVVRDFMDLTVEPYLQSEDYGEIPEWYSSELDNTDWGSIISPEWKNNWEKTDFGGTWNDWALVEGLCPGQPFLVEFLPPCWHRCSYEYEEYDVDYFWEIVARGPRSPKQAARAWEQWQATCAKERQARRRQVEREHFKRTHDVEALFIRFDSFWSESYGDGYPPDGYIVELCTQHGGQIASGRSPSRSWPRETEHPSQDKAWADLVENVKKYLPHLDPEMVRKLPTRW